MHEARSDSPLCLWSTWAHICSVWTTSASSSAKKKKKVWMCIKYHLSVRGQLRTDSWYKWSCVQTRWGVTVPPLLPLQALLVSPGSLPLCPAETTGLLLVIITQIVVDMDLGQIHLNSRSNDKGFFFFYVGAFSHHPMIYHQWIKLFSSVNTRTELWISGVNMFCISVWAGVPIRTLHWDDQC